MSRGNHNNNKEFEGSVELVSLDANDPTVIFQNIDQSTTVNGYIPYGVNDEQFNYLLWLYTKSTTHNAVTNSVSMMTYGDGLNDSSVIDPKENKRIVKDWSIFGNAAIQVTRDGIYHIPVNYLRAAPINEFGEIPGYYYSTDFENDKDPVFYPSWYKGWKAASSKDIAIYYVRSYQPNAVYYGLPSFQGGLSYMEQEIEIADFLLNYIKNSFSVTKIINFNNGISDPKAREANTKSIKKKFTGADGDKIIVAHNKSQDHAATIEDVTVDNASEQYEYMTKNARSQIIVAHQIVTPTLVGVRDDSVGFSSNAEEMTAGRIVLQEMKIRPTQELLADAFNEIEGRTDIEYLSGLDEVAEIEDVEVKEPVELKKVNPQLADALIELGEDTPKGFELISTAFVDYDNDEKDNFSNKDGENLMLASTGTAFPNAKDSQDSDDIIIRYRYRGAKVGEREFCKKMLAADKIYRKTDIVRMGNQAVNPGMGVKGADTYSIWLYKGSVWCKHAWWREIYLRQGVKVDVKSPLAKTISRDKARVKGYTIPKNSPLVATPPHSMPKGGAYPD